LPSPLGPNLANFELLYRKPDLDFRAFPLRSPYLLIPVSGNDFVDQVYRKTVTRLRDEIASLLSLSLIFFRSIMSEKLRRLAL
jgi:hypothetical protein